MPLRLQLRWWIWICWGLLLFLGDLTSVSAQPEPTKGARKKLGVRSSHSISAEPTGEHFAPASTAWNGCSRWMQIAMQEGLTIETPKKWDWRTARVQDPIILLSPQNEDLKTKPLLDFVKAGGRVLLTDDFGAGDNLWEAFGLWGRRTPLAPGKSPLIDVHFTVTHPMQDADFLLRQASFVFLNVPQWFFINARSAVEPLLFARAYRSNQPDKGMEGYILVRARRGNGVMVILTDPSALINQMIVYGDNRRLAKNLVQFLARPLQAKRLIVLSGNFSWKGEFTTTPPALARASLYLWDLFTDFNRLLTTAPALFKAFPPHWKQQSKLANARYRVAQARSDLITRSHLKHLSHRWWLLSFFLLSWLAIGLRWMPWFREPPYDPEREQEEHIIPHRLTEQVDAHHNSSEDFLWPLLVLKEEFAHFLHHRLDPLLPNSSTSSRKTGFSIPERLSAEVKPKNLTTSSLSLTVWKQLVQSVRNKQQPKMQEVQWKQIHHLLTQIPDRRDWEHLVSRSVKIKAKQFKSYYQAVMYCLHQLGLQDEFKAPLHLKNSNKP